MERIGFTTAFPKWLGGSLTPFGFSPGWTRAKSEPRQGHWLDRVGSDFVANQPAHDGPYFVDAHHVQVPSIIKPFMLLVESTF
jgi:hypothetical protein